MEIPDIPLTNEDPFGKITRPMAGGDQFPEAKIFKSVLYYSILILGAPVITFFIAKNLILSTVFQWGSDEVKTNVVSAIASVVVLHLALGLFIAKAYFGEEDEKRKIGKSD